MRRSRHINPFPNTDQAPAPPAERRARALANLDGAVLGVSGSRARMCLGSLTMTPSEAEEFLIKYINKVE